MAGSSRLNPDRTSTDAYSTASMRLTQRDDERSGSSVGRVSAAVELFRKRIADEKQSAYRDQKAHRSRMAKGKTTHVSRQPSMTTDRQKEVAVLQQRQVVERAKTRLNLLAPPVSKEVEKKRVKKQRARSRTRKRAGSTPADKKKFSKSSKSKSRRKKKISAAKRPLRRKRSKSLPSSTTPLALVTSRMLSATGLLDTLLPESPNEGILRPRDGALVQADLLVLADLSGKVVAARAGGKIDLSDECKTSYGALISKILGNPSAGHQLRQLAVEAQRGVGTLDLEVLEALAKGAVTIRPQYSVTELSSRLHALVKGALEKHEASDSAKLRLEELGYLEAYTTDLDETLALIRLLGLHQSSPVLGRVQSDFELAQMVLGQLERNLSRFSPYKPGDIMLFDQKKRAQFKNRELDSHARLLRSALGMPLNHAGVVCRDDDGQELMSHLVQGHQLDDFGVRHKTTTTGYRLDPARLVTKDRDARILLNALMESKGTTLDVGLRKHYQRIQNQLHSKETADARYQLIQNDASLRNWSGIAEVFGTHKRLTSQFDVTSLHQEFYGDVTDDRDEQRQICSEFVVRTLLAGLIELEKQLKTELVEKLLTDDSSLVRETVERQVAGISLFKLPINPRQKLSLVNPVRLLKLLEKHNAAVRVDRQPLVKAIVRAEDLRIHRTEAQVRLAQISGFRASERDLRAMIPVELTDDDLIKMPDDDRRTLPVDPSIADKWEDSGSLSAQIGLLDRQKKLHGLMLERRDAIKALKEAWKKKLSKSARTEAAKAALKCLEEGCLKPCKGGQGGAYILFDKNGRPQFILKPIDEDILCLNNRKGHATPFDGSKSRLRRVRANIPQYTTVQTESLAYDVARLMGIEAYTPVTEPIVVAYEGFHDILDGTKEMKGADRDKLLDAIGAPDREKLCSIQRFVPNSQELIEAMLDLENTLRVKAQRMGYSEQQQRALKKACLDQKDFEACLLLGLISGETDGNPGNYRVFRKMRSDGSPILGMMKVDNALSFPESNRLFSTCLSHLENASEQISTEGRARILALRTQDIENQMRYYGKSDAAISAFRARVELLQTLVRDEPSLTLAEMETSIGLMRNEKEYQRQQQIAETEATTSSSSSATSSSLLEQDDDLGTFVSKVGDEGFSTFIQADDGGFSTFVETSDDKKSADDSDTGDDV